MTKLEKAFKFLQTGRKSALDIALHINTVAVGSVMADLRKRGCDIRSYFNGMSENGAMMFDYELLSWPKELYDNETI